MVTVWSPPIREIFAHLKGDDHEIDCNRVDPCARRRSGWVDQLLALGHVSGATRLLGQRGLSKSLSQGITMAKLIFASHTVGAAILPLMLFHQIQLMVCAALARRWGRRAGPIPGFSSQGGLSRPWAVAQPGLRSCFAGRARTIRCRGRDRTTRRANQQKSVQPSREKYSAFAVGQITATTPPVSPE
jgi:SBF-like CPA transporter family (DUF4137)